jgi:uncharacterized membrane protein
MAGKFGVRQIVVAGALGAVTVALSVAGIGYIPWFSGVSLSVLQVPTIIGAAVEGPVVGILVGAIFGATSLVQSAISPAKGPIDIFFVNPLVSVLPRILVGLAAWLVYSLFRGRLRGLAGAAAGLAGSLANTVFVLGALVLAGAVPLAVAAGVVVSNGLIEAAVSAVLSSAIVAAWKGVEDKRGVARLADEEDR